MSNNKKKEKVLLVFLLALACLIDEPSKFIMLFPFPS
jgi:hypothetical protein